MTEKKPRMNLHLHLVSAGSNGRRTRVFFLNGEHYYFKGVNAHQDHAGWGDAVTDSGFFRDVKLVKDAGFNFIRGSHYPHARPSRTLATGWAFFSGRRIGFWGTAGFKNPGAAALTRRRQGINRPLMRASRTVCGT